MSELKDLDIRLSVSEVKIQKVEEDLGENKIMLKDISAKVESVSNNFTKMNGTLPHIKETCDSIVDHLEALTKENSKQETKIAKNGLYIKVMWGLLAPVTIAIVGALIKIFIVN
jgi:chromosome segregation ATPase